ncbi:MAG: DUF63 family protein [Halobacteriaceae archaeon]
MSTDAAPERGSGPFQNIDPVRAWVGAFVGGVAALAIGSILFTEQVYAGFIWHYFWGPVYADAHSAACVVWDGGAQTLYGSASACRGLGGIVAEPGYTLVSEVGYMVVLLFMIAGVILLLRGLAVGEERRFFYALLPFIFLGGALRVVEDASDAVPTGIDPLLTYPLNTLLISPIIYFTLFAITLAALLGSVTLARRGLADDYARPLFGIGTVLLAVTLVYLVVRSVTTTYVEFHPIIFIVVVVGATAAAALTWAIATRYVPELRSGTGFIGTVVIWGHSIDGTANVVGLDWGAELGLAADLVPKHPVNRFVIDVTQAIVPPSVVDVIGDAWPFLLLKLVVATGAVWLFNEDMVEDSPRSTLLLLVAILAVGLGPGTRDLLRATFGV